MPCSLAGLCPTWPGTAHWPAPPLRFGAAELGRGQSADELVAAVDGALLQAKRISPYYTF